MKITKKIKIEFKTITETSRIELTDYDKAHVNNGVLYITFNKPNTGIIQVESEDVQKIVAFPLTSIVRFEEEYE